MHIRFNTGLPKSQKSEYLRIYKKNIGLTNNIFLVELMIS